MSYSQATLIRNIRSTLGDFPWQDTCTEPMDATETGLDVADTTKWSVGDVVEFQDDGERCLVTALASATTLTVIRNFDASNGSAVGTGSTHSTSAQVAKSPNYPYLSVVDAISDSIYGLWPYVYKGVTYSITPVAGTRWYELDDGATNTTVALELQSVFQDVNSKPFYYGQRRTAFPVRIHFDVPTTVAGSGVAVEIPYIKDTTNTISVRCITPILPTVAGGLYSDLTVGIPANTVRYYAIATLIERLGILRVASDDITMTDESVKPGMREQVAQYWERKALDERHKWESQLKRTLPRKNKKAGDFA